MPSADLGGFDALPDEALSDRAFHLVAQARRLADRSKFAEANAKLDEADRLVPGLSEAAEARRKVAQLATPEGRFALQIARARNAIGSDDYSGADEALAEAAKLTGSAGDRRAAAGHAGRATQGGRAQQPGLRASGDHA